MKKMHFFYQKDKETKKTKPYGWSAINQSFCTAVSWPWDPNRLPTVQMNRCWTSILHSTGLPPRSGRGMKQMCPLFLFADEKVMIIKVMMMMMVVAKLFEFVTSEEIWFCAVAEIMIIEHRKFPYSYIGASRKNDEDDQNDVNDDEDNQWWGWYNLFRGRENMFYRSTWGGCSVLINMNPAMAILHICHFCTPSHFSSLNFVPEKWVHLQRKFTCDKFSGNQYFKYPQYWFIMCDREANLFANLSTYMVFW